MERGISSFCRSLATFCNHVESSTQALSDSIQRRPIPLDSAASAFLQSLERRISSTSTDLDFLESMAFGTVSFEELLGHCNQVYKTNDKYIAHIQDRMNHFGYIPEIELKEDDDDADLGFSTPDIGSVSAARWTKGIEEDDPLLEDGLSLQNLGLSDACLATLASKDYLESPTISSEFNMSQGDGYAHESTMSTQQPKTVFSAPDATRAMVKASKVDYDSLPSYMKSLASWEEFEEAVIMMNSYLCKKDEAMGSAILNQDDLEKLGLGRKGRSYLLLLLRMNQLAVENADGSILYRVVRADCL